MNTLPLYMPAVLWCASVVCSLAILGVCIAQYWRVRHSIVQQWQPVSKACIMLHLGAVACAAAIYPVYYALATQYDAMPAWYHQYGLPCVVVAVLCIAASLVAMYAQAWRAARNATVRA